ncbi:hypothetical protein ACOSQ2_028515 [Xanthoceras sorbifolium]
MDLLKGFTCGFRLRCPSSALPANGERTRHCLAAGRSRRWWGRAQVLPFSLSLSFLFSSSQALISQWPSSTSSYHVRYHCFVSPERYIVAIVTGSSKRARTALIKVLFHVPEVFEPWHFESPVEWLRFRDSNASGVSSLHLFAQIVDLAISHSILECFLSNSRRRHRSTAIVNLGYGVTRRECVNRGSSGSLPFSSSLAIANPVLDGIALP